MDGEDTRLAGATRATRVAMAVFVLAVLVLVGRNRFLSDGIDTIYATGPGEYTEFTLPDGSEVRLNVAGRMDLPVDFSTGRRGVSLDGEAYIEVRFDPRQPFVVETERMSVQTRGAAFDVRDYRVDSSASVVVFEGTILVRTPAAERSLGPGWRARLDAGGTQVDSIGVSESPAWLQGGLTFRDDRLGDVARELTRWYGVPVNLAHPSLDSLRLTADFYSESASEASREIADRLGLEIEVEGESILFILPDRR